MTYCVKEDIKTEMNITGTGDDELINTMIGEAGAFIDNQTGYKFAAVNDGTRYYSMSAVDGRDLILDKPLASITSITNGDSTTVTSAQYTVIPKNDPPYHTIRLLGSSGVSWTYTTNPEDAITIVGKWAVAAEAPEDIARACKNLVKWMYRQRESGDSERPIVSAEGFLLMPSAIPANVRDVIRSKRKLT